VSQPEIAKKSIKPPILAFRVIQGQVAHTLNFKQMFDSIEKKIVGGTPIPVGYGLAKLGHSVARVKISRRSTPWAEIWSSEKVDFVGIIKFSLFCFQFFFGEGRPQTFGPAFIN